MTSATFTVLPVISASDTNYSYGNLPPVITIGSSVPPSKIGNTVVTQYFTITDDVGILTTGIQLSAGSPVSTSAITQDDDKTITLELSVTATGDIGISATDTGGLTTTSIVSDFVLGNNSTSADLLPPGINFTNHNPSDRFIINDEGVTSADWGTVHVTVTDDVEIVYDNTNPENWIRLTDDSVGTIDPNSWVQTTSATVEFDVINISETGNVTVSARDYWGGRTNVESDGLWNVSCPDNGRLINLVNFLPQHLYESETYDFVKLFENYLNTMYQDKDEPCNYSILKKVEQIGDLHDPSLMDTEYLQFYANFLGYDLSLTRGGLGYVTSAIADDGSFIEDENTKKYLRFVVENLPNWYKIKSTRNAVRIMLFSFGVVGDLFTLFTNDYENNWEFERQDDNIAIGSEIPKEYYPSPHFNLAVNLRETPPSWIQNVTEIINAIESIRPINTVFERFQGYYDMDPSEIQVETAAPHTTVRYFINWTNSVATCATGDNYTNMYSDGVDGNQVY